LWDLHCALTDMFGWTDSSLHEFDIPLAVHVDGTQRRLLCDLTFGMPTAESPCLADWLFSLADLAALGSPALVVSFPDAFDIELAREFAEPIPTAAWRTFGYKYDFGDSWYVVLEVKGTSDQAGSLRMLGGDRAGPPNDFGGIETFNAYIAGEGDTEDRREWRARIKNVAGKWTPTGWQPEAVGFSSPLERLARMLAYDGDDELIPDPKGTAQERVDRFVRNNLDDIEPIIEDHLDRVTV